MSLGKVFILVNYSHLLVTLGQILQSVFPCEHVYLVFFFNTQEANSCFLCMTTGHGGSDGLHGYVPSLDYVIEDIVSLYF